MELTDAVASRSDLGDLRSGGLQLIEPMRPQRQSSVVAGLQCQPDVGYNASRCRELPLPL